MKYITLLLVAFVLFLVGCGKSPNDSNQLINEEELDSIANKWLDSIANKWLDSLDSINSADSLNHIDTTFNIVCTIDTIRWYFEIITGDSIMYDDTTMWEFDTTCIIESFTIKED